MTIDLINAAQGSIHFQKIVGDYTLGYIYGNVKTHKNGNPLRPIISQIPSPTYHLAKKLNSILTPYVPNKYSLQSSADFLRVLRESPNEGIIASLDVESLFTNVPVDETISLILDRVYRDDSTPTLDIPEHALRSLLELCTKKAPFITHRGEMYSQIDGVAMGSPLGVLFANFYMGIVEERVFSLLPAPLSYGRYVDDTFVKVSDDNEIDNLIQKFEENSVLRFTCERSIDGKLPFLDVLVTQTNTGIHTEVYVKETNLGLCLNGRSECPDRYKRSAITAYVQRALSHCSSCQTTHKELERAT